MEKDNIFSELLDAEYSETELRMYCIDRAISGLGPASMGFLLEGAQAIYDFITAKEKE